MHGNTINMEFGVNIETLSAMLTFVRDQAVRLKIPPKAILRMELACEEALVNIISYSNTPDCEKIFIDCNLTEETHFHVVIKDSGPAFNPLEVSIDPQKNIAVHERRIGGLGIYLIRKLVDEAIYVREGTCNVLSLTLRLEVPQEDN